MGAALPYEQQTIFKKKVRGFKRVFSILVNGDNCSIACLKNPTSLEARWVITTLILPSFSNKKIPLSRTSPIPNPTQ